MQLFPNTRIPPRLQQFSCTCHLRIRRQKSLYRRCKGTGEKEASASPLFSLDRLLSVDISSFILDYLTSWIITVVLCYDPFYFFGTSCDWGWDPQPWPHAAVELSLDGKE